MHLRLLALFACAVILASTVAGALAESTVSPIGTWEASNRETRYKIDYCQDGTRLCATLVWVTDAKPMPKTLPYLNKKIAAGFRRARSDTWKGPVSFNGIDASGTLKLLDSDHIRLTACKFVLFCTSIDMTRYSSAR